MAGIDGFGTTLEIDINDDLFVTGLTAGELTNIDILDVTVDDYDVTTHDSPGQWREYIGGLKDGGALSADLNFDPALHGAILDVVKETHDVKITLPADADDAEVTFSGYINAMSAAAPHDDKLEAEITIKVSGAPTLTIPA
jgi:predicted secreted protein